MADSLDLALAPPPVPRDSARRSPAPSQARLFRQLRYRLVRNGFRVLVSTGLVRLVTMVLTSLVVAAFVFGMSWYGIHSLFAFKIPVKGLIVGGLFDMLFFTLGVMLVFSTGIILYASLFTAPEAKYLLSTPARADEIFATKFQAAVGFSSWAFLILGVPILVAYGLVAGAAAWFYVLLPFYLLGFVILPGAVSALLMLLVVRYLPKNRKQFLVAVGIILLLVGGVWGVRVLRAVRSTVETSRKNEVEGLLGQFAFLSNPYAPSHWATQGILDAARGDGGPALLRLAMLWSNGLVGYLVAAAAARRYYRTAFDRLAGGGSRGKVYRASTLDKIMRASVFYLDKPTRILIEKDFRTFRRDPSQWALLAVFGGLLMLMALNFRQLVKNDLARLDKFAVSLICVSATSVFLCAILSRFIFPLVSLEGRKFWILGLMPVDRMQILRGKFAFAATLSTVLATGLILISDLMIEMPAEAVLLHLVAVTAVAVGLSAMNVGLGAYMPNFRETDPSKIVVGFGGTVNIVLGLMFTVLVIGAMVGPGHVSAIAKASGSKFASAGEGLPGWAYLGVPLGLALTAVAVVVPLRMGGRALRETEF